MMFPITHLSMEEHIDSLLVCGKESTQGSIVLRLPCMDEPTHYNRAVEPKKNNNPDGLTPFWANFQGLLYVSGGPG